MSYSPSEEPDERKRVFLRLQQGPGRVEEMSRELNMDDSKVSRICNTLVDYGVLKKLSDGVSYALWTWREKELSDKQFKEYLSHCPSLPSLREAAIGLGKKPVEIKDIYYRLAKEWRPPDDDTKWIC